MSDYVFKRVKEWLAFLSLEELVRLNEHIVEVEIPIHKESEDKYREFWERRQEGDEHNPT